MATARAAAPAPPSSHRSWGQNPPYPCPIHRAATTQSASNALRYNASPPHHRRHASRSSPARQSADSATKNPAPDAPAPHTRTSRRADGIYPAHHRPHARISPVWHSLPAPSRASRIECGAAPVFVHQPHRVRLGL